MTTSQIFILYAARARYYSKSKISTLPRQPWVRVLSQTELPMNRSHSHRTHSPRLPHRSPARLSVPLFCTLLVFAGCSNEGDSKSGDGTQGQQVQGDPAAKGSAAKAKSDTKTGTANASQARQSTTAEMLSQAGKKLKARDLDGALEQLSTLKKQAKKLSKKDAGELANLESQLEELVSQRADGQRAANLTRARDLLAAGDLENSMQALESLFSSGPTQEQLDAGNKLKREIERRRKVRRELKVAMQLLASSDRGEVRSGQSRLWQEKEDSLPLLLDAVTTDNPTLVTNALEMLRRMNEPGKTLPAMLGVLARENQEQSWPAAVQEIQRMAQPGAGEPLLKLVQTSTHAAQRVAALQALTGVPDPPAETLLGLLPMLYKDGPDLGAALACACRAVQFHHQEDLSAQRGLPSSISTEALDQLAQLKSRLEAIIAAGSKGDALDENARAALTLAVATRLLEPHVLTGVTIVNVSAENPDTPGTAVLDGVWNSVELATMWRHAVQQRGSLVFDLGSERTVSSVKIWNYNEPAGMHRGWKEVEIFVSDSPAPLTPVAEGIVAVAPGAKDTPDYGSLIPVPLVRGRYVKLQARSVWREDLYKGISEVQISGF